MRTTVTLDADTDAALRRSMTARGISFKRALNDAIRAGLAPRMDLSFTTTVHELGAPTVDLDRALSISSDLEDEPLVRATSELP